MMGSKRVRALEDELATIRRALEGQTMRFEAGHAADEDLRARLDALGAALAAMAERVDAVELHGRHHADAEQAVIRLSEEIAAERAQRTALEQAIVKLEKRLEVQTDDMRVTATAMLERLDRIMRARSSD